MTNKSAAGQLPKLEKIVGRIIRKSLKNNTLDYTVQISISSTEPRKVKYSAYISSPNKEVHPILFSYDTFEMLEAALLEAEKQYNPKTVEIAFLDSRINTYESKIEQSKARKKQLEDPDYKPEDDNIEDDTIEMEQV